MKRYHAIPSTSYNMHPTLDNVTLVMGNAVTSRAFAVGKTIGYRRAIFVLGQLSCNSAPTVIGHPESTCSDFVDLTRSQS
jgi:hypothetical protein